MECWSSGVVEHWSVVLRGVGRTYLPVLARLGNAMRYDPITQYSTTPILHGPIAPFSIKILNYD
jgi:hypothetical protein